MVQSEKIMAMPKHLMNERMKQPNRGRIKRSSFVKESRQLGRAQNAKLPPSKNISHDEMYQPWEESPTNLRIVLDVPKLTSGDSQNDVIKCTLTQAMIEGRNPPEAWIEYQLQRGRELNLESQLVYTAQTTLLKYMP